MLDDLVAAGYLLGVLTNGQRAQQVAKLTRIGLLDLFAVVVASSQLAAGKPDPRAFTALCQQLGTAPGSVVFVGDDPVADVTGARGAGMQALLLNRAQVGWAPDGVSSIRSLTDLPATLREVDRATGGGAGGCPT